MQKRILGACRPAVGQILGRIRVCGSGRPPLFRAILEVVALANQINDDAVQPGFAVVLKTVAIDIVPDAIANGYLTAYLHLSRYGPGVRSGRRVSQGDVIGYVGATGLVTGAHLDYRVQRNGRWIDPLSLRSVPADPVPTERLPEFMAWRDRLRESLFEGAPPPSEIEFPETQLAEKPTAERPTTVVGGVR